MQLQDAQTQHTTQTLNGTTTMDRFNQLINELLLPNTELDN
jgi:hypothetical protein